MTRDRAAQVTAHARLTEKLIAHHVKFRVLPLISVPSAVITDQQVEQWTRESYDTDLAFWGGVK